MQGLRALFFSKTMTIALKDGNSDNSQVRACNSVGECYLHTVEVVGSNPIAPIDGTGCGPVSFTDITRQFSDRCSALSFTFDGYVYNPLDYAWDNHREYLERYVKPGAAALFLGMNPGPFGMLQTGVPFGEINAVKNYLKINNPVGIPEKQHPGRPVLGMDINRSEISGKRLWGLLETLFPDAQDLVSFCAVVNFCPLGFLDSGKTAKNITPDKLLRNERKALEDLCLEYLSEVVSYVRPQYLVGVGQYAKQKLEALGSSLPVCSIIHPSPGNPQANKDWNGKVLSTLKENGIWN